MEPGTTALAERDVITPGSVIAEPWANGLGVTRVLERRLAWRLSVAEIRGSHRFSTFPGIDRLLLVTGDQPLGLMIDGRPHRLKPGEAIEFPGEARVVPAPTALGATVVNLMTSRALATARCRRIELTRRRIIRPDEASVTVVLTGEVRLDGGASLPPGTALLPSARQRTVTGSGTLAALTITPQADGPLPWR
ncbi:HutD family protein [Microbacterium aurantiacum]|uniref:HutD family protein n=1 Tax=Microbacterium aurantiacum TaxID=162393 RepID=UPI0034361BF5